MDTKYFAVECEYMLHEDDWNKGRGDLIARWDEAECIESADTIEEVLEQVNYLDRDAFGQKPINEVFENDPCQNKDYSRFDADLLVDIVDGVENIVKPTEEKYKQFERGEVKLYALHVCVYVNKQTSLDEDDVKRFNCTEKSNS